MWCVSFPSVTTLPKFRPAPRRAPPFLLFRRRLAFPTLILLSPPKRLPSLRVPLPLCANPIGSFCAVPALPACPPCSLSPPRPTEHSQVPIKVTKVRELKRSNEVTKMAWTRSESTAQSAHELNAVNPSYIHDFDALASIRCPCFDAVVATRMHESRGGMSSSFDEFSDARWGVE
ncbi:hypothetical protein B0H10DRAFT_2436946 [Mycena sp. CBHHK59/15]|nr:hypothetical protein B0H10DRAFT_2436946 [Mycena sp. CBHHK59/15]